MDGTVWLSGQEITGGQRDSFELFLGAKTCVFVIRILAVQIVNTVPDAPGLTPGADIKNILTVWCGARFRLGIACATL